MIFLWKNLGGKLGGELAGKETFEKVFHGAFFMYVRDNAFCKSFSSERIKTIDAPGRVD